jgi:hypothetical protein
MYIFNSLAYYKNNSLSQWHWSSDYKCSLQNIGWHAHCDAGRKCTLDKAQKACETSPAADKSWHNPKYVWILLEHFLSN